MSWFIAHLSTMTPLGAYAWLGGILLLCGLGLPIPEDISLIAAGYFSWKGVLYIHTAFAICFAAVVTGDTAAFFMGRLFGAPYIPVTPWLLPIPRRVPLRIVYGEPLSFSGAATGEDSVIERQVGGVKARVAELMAAHTGGHA